MRLVRQLMVMGAVVAAAVGASAGSAHAQGDGELLSLLGNPSVVLACFPAGQVGNGNTVNGTQNISCSQSASATSTTPPPNGNGGITGSEVAHDSETVDAGQTATPLARCPAGKEATGGGFFADDPELWSVQGSGPAEDGEGHVVGWAGRAVNTGTGPQEFHVQAVCVDSADRP